MDITQRSPEIIMFWRLVLDAKSDQEKEEDEWQILSASSFPNRFLLLIWGLGAIIADKISSVSEISVQDSLLPIRLFLWMPTLRCFFKYQKIHAIKRPWIIRPKPFYLTPFRKSWYVLPFIFTFWSNYLIFKLLASVPNFQSDEACF